MCPKCRVGSTIVTTPVESQVNPGYRRTKIWCSIFVRMVICKCRSILPFVREVAFDFLPARIRDPVLKNKQLGNLGISVIISISSIWINGGTKRERSDWRSWGNRTIKSTFSSFDPITIKLTHTVTHGYRPDCRIIEGIIGVKGLTSIYPKGI